METEMLEIESLSSGTSYQPTIELSSSANRLSTLRASGAYTRFSASSSTSLSVENASTSSESSPSSSSSSSLQTDHLDLRSYEGDLTVRDPIRPSPDSIDTHLSRSRQGSSRTWFSQFLLSLSSPGRLWPIPCGNS